MGVGIVGAGLMGREIATAIQRWPALIEHPVSPRVTAIADINPAALDWFDQLGTVTTKATDYRDLLAAPDVDVVYIAVRHDLHEQFCIDSVRAGKDLLAEKPFGIDAVASTRIIEEIDEHPGVFVRVSSEMPFFPGAQKVLALLRSGALGQIIEARNSFLHSSDLNVDKPINWKRQRQFCGAAGVMNDLGMHALHVPLRLGWHPTRVFATLQNLVPTRPGPDGDRVECDTFENAVLVNEVEGEHGPFPLYVEVKRIAPGHKNTWSLRVEGMQGAVEFSTRNPKAVRVLTTASQPSLGQLAGEQLWQRADAGSQSVWPTVTGPIFESGFSDAILQMLAAFFAERAGLLGDRFGCATPQEARTTHDIFAAALRSHELGVAIASPASKAA
ncbi:Gfo/Idh/MocA family protein [Streptomyces aculeolatus]